METAKSNRRSDIDALKGIAIIAVILYHLGLLRSGYLGVDIFFVISGFLAVPKVLEQVQSGEFKYFKYITARLFRFLPLILIVCAICLACGYIFMLPDDYENLSESVFASVIFSNNILSGVTTKNYWDVGNHFKPLMHLWYIGVLVEFYFVFPAILLIGNKIRAKIKKYSRGGVRLTACCGNSLVYPVSFAHHIVQ